MQIYAVRISACRFAVNIENCLGVNTRPSEYRFYCRTVLYMLASLVNHFLIIGKYLFGGILRDNSECQLFRLHLCTEEPVVECLIIFSTESVVRNGDGRLKRLAEHPTIFLHVHDDYLRDGFFWDSALMTDRAETCE